MKKKDEETKKAALEAANKKWKLILKKNIWL